MQNKKTYSLFINGIRRAGPGLSLAQVGEAYLWAEVDEAGLDYREFRFEQTEHGLQLRLIGRLTDSIWATGKTEDEIWEKLIECWDTDTNVVFSDDRAKVELAKKSNFFTSKRAFNAEIRRRKNSPSGFPCDFEARKAWLAEQDPH